MDSKSKSIAAIAVFSLLLTGCGGGGGDGDGDGGGGTQIQSADDGAAAAGAGTAGATAGATISDIASNLGNLTNAALGGKPALSKPTHPLVSRSPRHAKMVAMTQKMVNSPTMQKAVAKAKTALASRGSLVAIDLSDQPCDDGGTYSTTRDIHPDGSFTTTTTFNSCQRFAQVTDGVMDLSGSVNPVTGATTFYTTLDDFITQKFKDTTYAILLGIFTNNMTIEETFLTTTDPDTGIITDTVNSTINGSSSFEDKTVVPSQTTNLNMNGFTSDSISTFDPDTGDRTRDDTLNGNVTETWTDDGPHTVAVNFDDFNTHVVTDVVLASPSAFSHDPDGSWDISYSGSLTINFTPNADCDVEGTFTFEPVEPLHIGFNDSCPVSGHLDVTDANDNTAHLHFNSDGSVNVAVGEDPSPGDPPTYDSCEELDAFCDVVDFEQDVESETEVGGDEVNTSGDTLIANLNWSPSGVDIGTIMDLHINYYAESAPTGSTTGIWYIDWHNRDVPDVLPDRDTNGDGVINNVPDVNGVVDDGNLEYYYVGQGADEATDFDRLVIDGLPVGYYVISVNSFNLGFATSVTANVTLNIGGNVFTFPSCVFTTDDGEEVPQDPSSWCRVKDMQVNADGTVDLLPPNTALEPWHDGAFGLFKPSPSKPRR